MSVVASKCNTKLTILGNTHDEDSDKEVESPVKVIDKAPMRTTKRNAPVEAPIYKAPTINEGRGGSRGLSGNEAAFRDRNAGSAKNRGKPTDPAERGKTYGSSDGRGRGGRGGPRNFDRHSRGVVRDSEKQAGQGWGANEGGAELADEQAGEALANAEKDAPAGFGGADPPTIPAQEPEPEETSISYAEYVIQQQEKKAALSAQTPQIRKPNEGGIKDKKWANAKPVVKDDAADFVQPAVAKTKRERERRQKQFIEIDQRFVESSDRGGRGSGYQGGRNGRGGRGDSYQRGNRSGGGGVSARNNSGLTTSINTNDTNAFPSLGS